jgi:hypothetical protein
MDVAFKKITQHCLKKTVKESPPAKKLPYYRYTISAVIY